MRIAVVVLALTVAGMLAVAAALSGDPLPPASIPLRAAAVATPVMFPRTPPIRSTPMFVGSSRTAAPFLDWHRKTLMRWYLAEPTPDPNWVGH